MIIEIRQLDLFSVPKDYYLCQCISADFGMGKGIAVEFNKRFDMKNKLKKKYGSRISEWDKNPVSAKGECILEGKVFNLITKREYFNKPVYAELTSALIDMRDIAEKEGISKIAMPRIGCGLDRLNWIRVEYLIKKIFEKTDVEILVCEK